MSDQLKHTLYTPTDCIPEQTMFDYIDHKLSPKEQHVVEKHLLECELCSDAMDGLRLVKNRGIIQTINREISEKMAAPVIVQKQSRINFKVVMSVAAGLLLLMGGVFFFNHLSPSAEEKSTVADLKVKQEEDREPPMAETTAPAADSLKAAVNKQIPVTGNAYAATADDEAPAPAREEEAKQEKAAEEPAPDELRKAKTQQTERAEKPKTAQTLNLSSTVAGTASPAASTTKVMADSISIANNGFGSATYEWTFADKNADGTGNAPAQKESDNELQPGTYATTEEAADDAKAEQSKDQTIAEAKKANTRAGDSKTTPAASSTLPAYAPPDLAQNSNGFFANSTPAADAANKTVSGKTKTADVAPQFPGGDLALLKFITANAKWPATDADKAITSTKIYAQFTIDKDGNVKNPKILKGINPAYDKEALRIIGLMPKWKPATNAGKAVDYIYTLPIQLEFK